MQFRTPASPAEWEAITRAFIVRHLESSGAGGVVLGMSGGIDSAVVGALAIRALGSGRVQAYAIPAADSDPRDEEHARLACKTFGIPLELRPIAEPLEGFARAFPKEAKDKRILGNTKSRMRMVALYALAQSRGWLVCGTGNKSELLTGYFTKHGDGAADLQPIGDLYKTQVRQLALHLGVPDAIINKPPSAGLHPGQTDEGEMGVSYEELDAILKGLELNQSVDAVARRTGLDKELVAKVDGMVRASEHKRRMAMAPKIGVRTVGIDWRRSVQWRR